MHFFGIIFFLHMLPPFSCLSEHTYLSCVWIYIYILYNFLFLLVLEQSWPWLYYTHVKFRSTRYIGVDWGCIVSCSNFVFTWYVIMFLKHLLNYFLGSDISFCLKSLLSYFCGIYDLSRYFGGAFINFTNFLWKSWVNL